MSHSDSTLADEQRSASSPPNLQRTTLGSPIGPMIAVASDDAVCLLEFNNRRALNSELGHLERRFGRIALGTNSVLDRLKRELGDYFAGRSALFSVPRTQRGSTFEEMVWRALEGIPPGQTRSYGDIAKTIGHPDMSREVGQANGANNISIIVPCHRVIGADGSLVGYGGGLWRKKWLLDHEKQYAWSSFESNRP